MKNRNRIIILCISFFASSIMAQAPIKLSCSVQNGKTTETIDWVEQEPTNELAQAQCQKLFGPDAKFVNFIVGNV